MKTEQKSVLAYLPHHVKSYGIGYAAHSIAMRMNSNSLVSDLLSVKSDFARLDRHVKEAYSINWLYKLAVRTRDEHHLIKKSEHKLRKIVKAKKFNNDFIEIWGTGNPKREVMHVDDLASAIYFIINKKVEKNKKLMKYLRKNSLINVGSGNEYSIKQFATKIAKVVNCKSKFKFNKSLPDGTMRKILDSTLINKIGWKSKISLTQGLNYTIDWYKKEHN